MADGLRVGEPITCRCGATMAVKFSEPVWSGDFHRKIKAGDRYMYVCDRCRRRCDVRWYERDVRAEGRGQRSEVSGQRSDPQPPTPEPPKPTAPDLGSA